MKISVARRSLTLLPALLCLCTLASTGCQTFIGGQTLPSPDYLSDDVQYFPTGPENKLFNQEQARLRAAGESAKLDTF